MSRPATAHKIHGLLREEARVEPLPHAPDAALTGEREEEVPAGDGEPLHDRDHDEEERDARDLGGVAARDGAIHDGADPLRIDEGQRRPGDEEDGPHRERGELLAEEAGDPAKGGRRRHALDLPDGPGVRS